jgi:hypothetical protein
MLWLVCEALREIFLREAMGVGPKGRPLFGITKGI